MAPNKQLDIVTTVCLLFLRWLGPLDEYGWSHLGGSGELFLQLRMNLTENHKQQWQI